MNRNERNAIIFKRTSLNISLKQNGVNEQVSSPKIVHLKSSEKKYCQKILISSPVNRIIDFSSNGIQSNDVKVFAKEFFTDANHFKTSLNESNFAHINDAGQFIMSTVKGIGKDYYFSGKNVFRCIDFDKRVEGIVENSHLGYIFVVYSEPKLSDTLVHVTQEAKDMEKHVTGNYDLN